MAFLDFMQDRSYPEHLRNALLARIRIERPELFDRLQKQKDLFIQKSQSQMQTQ
jgi:hypothetical protein